MEPTAQQDRKSQGIPVGRPQWGDEAAVVVPKLESQQRVAAMIDPGSGIVACAIPSEPGRLLVYYEGNRMGACNMNTLEDRTLNAYGRMAKSYPTVAMAMLDAIDILPHQIATRLGRGFLLRDAHVRAQGCCKLH